jgi:hypothetical protein
VTTPVRVLPDTDDPGTKGFWELARRHELGVMMCTSCGAACHLARQRCTACGSWQTQWRSVPGRGRLYSWTVVRRQVHPYFTVPYTLVLVELDQPAGIRVLGRLDGAQELTAGAAMHVVYEDVDARVTLPSWEPVPGSAE